MRGKTTQPVINLVVTCSNRKSVPASPSLQARNLRGRSFEMRRSSWTKRLSDVGHAVLPATEVYQGDHWSVVRSIGLLTPLGHVNIWIASAGYGLITPTSPIAPYAATLSPRHLDSVARDSNERREWWSGLIERPLVADLTVPRSLRDVARKFKHSPLLVASSSEYIDAMANDLVAAREELEDPILLSVLCRKGAAPPELRDVSITLQASYSSVLGGALTSLNVRVLRWLIEQSTAKLTRHTVAQLLAELAAQSTVQPIPKRAKLTDAQVKDQIHAALHVTARISQSALLRVVRNNGLAVEQRRFARIYNEVMEEAPHD
jgi:hypothetical protein